MKRSGWRRQNRPLVDGGKASYRAARRGQPMLMHSRGAGRRGHRWHGLLNRSRRRGGRVLGMGLPRVVQLQLLELCSHRAHGQTNV